ncbi:hypothetical protein SAMN05444156_0675 [Verrucomicrobium sp. GAS474]|uniref:hypothetical protein n=1 Tax=Verrucomicrobium sp. GAS474 TaxID=1882831 RepID=UPI0008794CA3|nr:hypothetical protein [Verrucomicrobium sp. GAS474]SDT91238.1 hypothetical protein SAMN05444156_0675 [Verrucomicrobium sp. GAS474]
MSPEHDHVAANYRYIAAYNEVTARVAQRQQSLVFYSTLVFGLLAALLGTRRPDGTASTASFWILYGFAIASACLTLLNFKYELTIANLRRFLSELESLNNPGLVLPSFNLQPQWAKGANAGRRFHDYTSALLIAAGNGVALGLLFANSASEVFWHAPAVWITGLTAVAAIVAHLRLAALSYKPLNVS